MTDEGPQQPAGPDRIQRWNSARMLVFSAALVIFAVVTLANSLGDGKNPTFPAVLLIGGLIGVAFGVRLVRRHWVKRDGVTLDEADPDRTPEEQRLRDDRVRKANEDMTPGQEIGLGIALVPISLVFGAAPVMSGDDFNYVLAIGISAIGLVLLVRGLVRSARRRS
jgi:peptidoglycan/LPS O-acetylase OafA/YrhL